MTRAAADPITVIAAPTRCLLAAGAVLVDAGEVARCGGLLRAEDRDRFTAAHWLKRCALARLTGELPERLRFALGPAKKPLLETGAVEFNLSHAGDWIALALARAPVGVDVEASRTAETWGQVIPAIAAPDDAPLPPLHLWTAKEAALKAEGLGFLRDPRGLAIRRRGDGFSAELSTGMVQGEWRAADPAHLIAVAGNGPVLWHLARDRTGITSALATLR